MNALDAATTPINKEVSLNKTTHKIDLYVKHFIQQQADQRTILRVHKNTKLYMTVKGQKNNRVT